MRPTRIGAYALSVVDGSVLLVRVSPRGGNAGRWTLPGGGVDWGEDPEVALHRELHEETGLAGEIGEVIGVESIVFESYQPDFATGVHSVRIVYQVTTSGEPQVIEADGTTDDAAWVPLDAIEQLETVELVDFALSRAGLT